MKLLYIVMITVCSLTVASCSTISKNMGLTENNGGEGSDGTREYKDYLPFIEIDTWGLEYSTQNDFYDKYTRIFIVPDVTRVGCPAGNKTGNCSRLQTPSSNKPINKRDYNDESRSWLARWLVGKTVSQAFVTTFSLNKDETTFSSELFSLSFDSNNVEGETWATSQNISTIVSPYFKVGAGDTLGMKATLSLSENSQSEVSANVISALSTAAIAIAPQSSIVTTLSSDRISKASSFLDQNVSALFDKSISETMRTDIQLEKYCGSNGFIAEIELNLPKVKQIKSSSKPRLVGKWFVYLESPIDSIFTKKFETMAPCNKTGGQLREWSTPDFTRLQLGDVLEFKVGDDLTIYDFVFSRLELTDMIKTLNEKASENTAGAAEKAITAKQNAKTAIAAVRAAKKATKKATKKTKEAAKTAEQEAIEAALEASQAVTKAIEAAKTAKEAIEAARSICARLERKLPELGLNTYDTAATLWATANSDQFKIEARDLLLHDDTCTTAKRWNSIANQPDIVKN